MIKVIECGGGNNNVKWVEKLTKSMRTKLMPVYVAVCLYYKTLKDEDIYLEIKMMLIYPEGFTHSN